MTTPSSSYRAPFGPAGAEFDGQCHALLEHPFAFDTQHRLLVNVSTDSVTDIAFQVALEPLLLEQAVAGFEDRPYGHAWTQRFEHRIHRPPHSVVTRQQPLQLLKGLDSEKAPLDSDRRSLESALP